ncbi:GNAT family N-acetyltransferase [Chengkuizengella sediminis]|uniref:GNAT family N-acetyltransferase n=1 Tax=Chengkuizengella sediminis TaxID=1885917 RepID=UPI001389D862|nr:GNAT family N-acetyltransferase [Chengkuizengella sediminis]NDI37135.1 GNAT family N-acetyltransferase [Chengkuizengella sediminis]
MNHVKIIENKLINSFKVLNGLPNYIAIEEKNEIEFDNEELQNNLIELIKIGVKLGINRISALINRTSQHYLNLSEMLIHHGFEPYASKVEVYRDLHDINSNIKEYTWRSIEEATISEGKFKECWKQCMSGSDNAPSSLTMDEHLNSVKSELGDNWMSSCKVIFLKDKSIGISIPHIEPGTIDEGRLFYFGVLPEHRGKGLSSFIHHQSLYLLKQMGASYYIGSTHEKNIKMQKVFQRNNCSIKAHTESYYKYFNI